MPRFGVSVVVFCLLGSRALTFDYETLRDTIQKNHFTSIEQVIAALPADYHRNYALMRTSRSLQEASAEASGRSLWRRRKTHPNLQRREGSSGI